MYRFLAAGSLNKSDQETDIDGPEPSWQLAQQGPSVPSKEKSGIRQKRIWDALEIFRSSWKFYWVHYCSNRSSLTSSCSFAWLEPHDGMKLDEGGLEEPGWFIWFGVSQDFDKDLRPCFPQSFRYVEILGQYWHRNIPSPLAAPFLFLFMFVTWIQLTKLDPHRALFILVPGASMCSCHEVAPDDALGADELKAAAGVSGLQDWVATLSHRWESLHLSSFVLCFILLYPLFTLFHVR